MMTLRNQTDTSQPPASFSIIPFRIPPGQSVFVVGAGGGYDFLCGLPVALALSSRGHTVHIGSYSATNLKAVEGGTWHGEHLLEINTKCRLSKGDYFPESHLARWYAEKGSDISIWCLNNVGVVPTLQSYDYLIDKLDIGTVICVDGGLDGIFKGNEHDMGTPSMDSISVVATSRCKAPKRIFACTAFGTEGTEGSVSHAQVLNRFADLMAADAMLGVGAILKHTGIGVEFLDAVNFIHDSTQPLRRGIIVSSIVAAMTGKFGYNSVHPKTEERKPWLSPLTALIWYFEADAVARMKLFHDDILDSMTVADVSQKIQDVRDNTEVKDYEKIPI